MGTSDQPVADFTITAQDHQPAFASNDPNASTWTIHFTTRSGVDSFITVDDADYNAPHVGQLIAARVAEIEAIHGLGQG